jgi:hypothetical protein
LIFFSELFPFFTFLPAYFDSKKSKNDKPSRTISVDFFPISSSTGSLDLDYAELQRLAVRATYRSSDFLLTC